MDKDVNKLKDIFSEHFSWGAWRIDFIARFILALLIARSVNYQKLTVCWTSKAKPKSTLRRIQRFMSGFVIDEVDFASFMIQSLGIGDEPFLLALDRTNWKFGVFNINILVLSVVHNGISFPLYWSFLSKQGNSNTDERIQLIDKFLAHYRSNMIDGLLGDREFIGKKWFRYLVNQDINFYIRIKKDTLVHGKKGKPVKVERYLDGLKVGESKTQISNRKLYGQKVGFAILKTEDGEVIIATNDYPSHALAIYRYRWSIECLFGQMKTRGFNLEDTHLKCTTRLSQLLALVTIALLWSYLTGVWREAKKKEKTYIKNHGYREFSVFRHGLDYLVQILVNAWTKTDDKTECFNLLQIKKKSKEKTRQHIHVRDIMRNFEV